MEDSTLSKAVQIRRKVLSVCVSASFSNRFLFCTSEGFSNYYFLLSSSAFDSYNRRRENFNTDSEWNDYLEQVEDKSA